MSELPLYQPLNRSDVNVPEDSMLLLLDGDRYAVIWHAYGRGVGHVGWHIVHAPNAGSGGDYIAAASRDEIDARLIEIDLDPYDCLAYVNPLSDMIDLFGSTGLRRGEVSAANVAVFKAQFARRFGLGQEVLQIQPRLS